MQNDAANKRYVDNKLPDSITEHGCCYFKNNRLVNVAKSKSDENAVTYKNVKYIFANLELSIDKTLPDSMIEHGCTRF